MLTYSTDKNVSTLLSTAMRVCLHSELRTVEVLATKFGAYDDIEAACCGEDVGVQTVNVSSSQSKKMDMLWLH